MSFLNQIPLLGNPADDLIKRCQWREAEILLNRTMAERERFLVGASGTQGKRRRSSLLSRGSSETGGSRSVESEREKDADEAELRELDNVKSLLGHVYRQLGQLREAEALDSAVLASRQQSMGYEHPETLVAMSHLATDIQLQPGRLIEGLTLERQVLEAVMKSHNDNHHHQVKIGTDVLLRMCHIADTYFAHDRAGEASQMHETVLRLCTTALGPGHPYTIAVMDSCGRDYAAQGRLSDAVVLLRDAVEAGKVHLGIEDATTRRCIVHLGETYGRLIAEGEGNMPDREVVSLIEHAMQILEGTVGINDTDTISLKYYLAVAYARVDGRFREAESMQSEVLNWCRRQLGDRSRTASIIVRNLVLMYRQLGRMDKAREIETEFRRITQL